MQPSPDPCVTSCAAAHIWNHSRACEPVTLSVHGSCWGKSHTCALDPMLGRIFICFLSHIPLTTLITFCLSGLYKVYLPVRRPKNCVSENLWLVFFIAVD
ncbi:hypothetical protein ElyMa_002434200 [Elysia marginata]|uniref:G-protein coupled receptors family 1 profile domain-containing protein n=1 Tax=Elysia marginata TaxID=1093978 RepID=A0AAV4GIJ0_9GAST|nr:hypothetical protein ElyMa_002434200 [Elysia marginata]